MGTNYLAQERYIKKGGDAAPETLQVGVDGAAAKIWEGAMCALLTATSMAVRAGTSATGSVVGVAEETVDNSAGADGALSVNLRQGQFWFNNSTDDPCSYANVGDLVYAYDDQTICATSNGGTKPPAGICLKYDATEGVLVQIGVAVGAMTPIATTVSLETRVSTEESTRASADTSLTTRVSTEESTRGSADTSLTTRVSTEESTRTSADTSLTTRVSTEESTRASADTSLTTRVSTEESTRASADTSITTRVSTEESTRASADTSLETRVSTEESTRASADTSIDTRADNASFGFSLYGFREVDANSDVANGAANGGVLASDTTPILMGGTNEVQQIQWATGNTDIVCNTETVPEDFDGTQDATLELWVSSGAVGPDPATFTAELGWDGAALSAVAVTDGAPGAAIHKITATVSAANIPDDPSFLMIDLTPAAHANDAIQLFGMRIKYKRTA